MLKPLVHRIGRAYLNHVVRDEAATHRPRADNERPIEYSFALRQLALARPQTVLDVGTGRSSWPHLLATSGYAVTAIDNVRDYWPRGMVNRHWPVRDVNIVAPNGFVESFDAITCLSVLEHIERFDDAMAVMIGALNPGGLLVVTCPYSAAGPYEHDLCMRSDVTRPKTHSYICQSFTAEHLGRWQRMGISLVAAEYWQMFSGPVFRTGHEVPWRLVSAEEPHQLACFAFHRQTKI